MISEPLNVAGHQNYPPGTAHGFAASISGNIGSFHHNLIAHAAGRSWSMAGNLDDAGYFTGYLDMQNNVVYNFGKQDHQDRWAYLTGTKGAVSPMEVSIRETL